MAVEQLLCWAQHEVVQCSAMLHWVAAGSRWVEGLDILWFTVPPWVEADFASGAKSQGHRAEGFLLSRVFSLSLIGTPVR